MTIKPISKKLKEPFFVVDGKTNTILPHDAIFCVNGYDFGDQLLEDVMFKAQLSKDRKTLTVIDVSNPIYFADLNEKQWMKTALNFFVNDADYVFPDDNYESSDWVIIPESHLAESCPDLFENRFDTL